MKNIVIDSNKPFVTDDDVLSMNSIDVVYLRDLIKKMKDVSSFKESQLTGLLDISAKSFEQKITSHQAAGLFKNPLSLSFEEADYIFPLMKS